MWNIQRLCVYCGSAGGVGEKYEEAAKELGTRLAAAGIGLVYGGGRVGLMGLLADAVLAGGGEVTGIIPARLRDAELGRHRTHRCRYHARAKTGSRYPLFSVTCRRPFAIAPSFACSAVPATRRGPLFPIPPYSFNAARSTRC
jgi:SLOG cluster4 family